MMTTLQIAAPPSQVSSRGAAAGVALQTWDELTLPARWLGLALLEHKQGVLGYLRLTWKLYLIRTALWIMKWSGWILVAISLKAPSLLLILNPNPAIIASVGRSMPIWLLFGIAVSRRMLPAQINYLIGARSLYVIEAAIRKHPDKRSVKIMACLMRQGNFIKLSTVFVATIYSPPGLPYAPNVYTYAGATKTKLLWVVAVNFAATFLAVLLWYQLGKVFNPLAWLGQWFKN
jgi:hypothetical protein